MIVKKERLWLAVLLAMVLTACGGVSESSPTPKPTTIRLPMGFVADVQFAPWYVAVEKGYFAEEGIELEFDYSWETDGVRLVGSGELPFAIASGDQVILARAQELPVTTITSWFQRFPVSVVALEGNGIEEPIDLVGQKVGIPETFGASYIGWRALASEYGLEEDDVELEVVGYTQLANLTEGRVDAAVVYANNEPVQLKQAGRDFVQFLVAEEVSLVSNGIIANETVLEERPELARAFVRAFLKGLNDTLEDPEGAFEICRQYVEGLEENEDVQRAVLDATIDYWRGEQLGESDPQAWRNTSEVMRSAELLQESIDLEKAFTNEFLP
jgi:NitT/TauT family transport system substrate-binding protein